MDEHFPFYFLNKIHIPTSQRNDVFELLLCYQRVLQIYNFVTALTSSLCQTSSHARQMSSLSGMGLLSGTLGGIGLMVSLVFSIVGTQAWEWRKHSQADGRPLPSHRLVCGIQMPL